MTRVKGGSRAHQRHKKVLKLARGYRGAKSKLFRPAREQVLHSLAYAFAHRKDRKADFRKLWISRINAAARMNGISYSRFINGLNNAGVAVNRKMLSELAVCDGPAFAQLTELAKANISGAAVR
ncbi:MAG: 50S ribosomal protein L20 [Peptococcaceae bacterium]|jgi:large subunit ribosomal protein L20|nr:50S ribosomal protein L20 [Peptococcaceae bacterium]